MYISTRKMKWLLNCYPPYLGAGIRLVHIHADWSEIEVRMKLRWFNRNAVGSHFGGSLYSMVDPHLMLMLMQRLGRDYMVWDKAASIEYVQPAKEEVIARIQLTDEIIEQILQNTQSGDKYLPTFEIQIVNVNGELIAKVTKTLYIRKKQRDKLQQA